MHFHYYLEGGRTAPSPIRLQIDGKNNFQRFFERLIHKRPQLGPTRPFFRIETGATNLVQHFDQPLPATETHMKCYTALISTLARTVDLWSDELISSSTIVNIK